MAKLIALSTVLFIVLGCRASETNLPVAVWDSGSKEVDKLVAQLVSERPAPYPLAFDDFPLGLSLLPPYMTIQVSNAMARLKQMGPSIAPALVRHLKDDRYSYSYIVAAWLNCSVGDAIIDVLSDGNWTYSGYKGRKTPRGGASYLSFKDYLFDKSPQTWADWAKSRTKLEIAMDFIDWSVAKERERGFVDAAQERGVLDTYQQVRDEVQKEYGKETQTINASEIIRRTNRGPDFDVYYGKLKGTNEAGFGFYIGGFPQRFGYETNAIRGRLGAFQVDWHQTNQISPPSLWREAVFDYKTTISKPGSSENRYTEKLHVWVYGVDARQVDMMTDYLGGLDFFRSQPPGRNSPAR